MNRTPQIIAVCTLATFLFPAGSWAGKKKKKPLQADPAASAAEIPALANLLEKAGWIPTPELSGGFKPGDIFAVTNQGHQWQGDGCFDAEPRVSTYTSIEVVSQLQVGVRTPLAGAEAGLSKKVKFGTPTHEAMPGMALQLTDACKKSLEDAEATADLSTWYVVKEVLRAEITELTCGKLDADGTFNPFVQLDASLTSACAVEALEPVAVAYRTVAVVDLPGIGPVESTPTEEEPRTAASLASYVRVKDSWWDSGEDGCFINFILINKWTAPVRVKLRFYQKSASGDTIREHVYIDDINAGPNPQASLSLWDCDTTAIVTSEVVSAEETGLPPRDYDFERLLLQPPE